MKNILQRRTFFLILALLIPVLCGGCWSRREIDKLGFIGSIAVDRAEDPKLLEVTAQFILPQALSPTGGAGGGVSGTKVWLMSARGPSVFETLFKINQVSPNFLFFGHTSSIIIGEKAAKKGVKEILDSFDRMPQFRRNVWIMVTPGKAKSILQARPKLQDVPSITIENLFSHQSITSVSYPSNLNSFFINLSSRSTSPIASRVTTLPNEGAAGTPGQVSGESDRREVKLEGAGVFKQDKLIGWLDGRETRGVLWVQGKMKRGTITFPNKQGNHKLLTLEVLTSQRKIHTFMNDGKLFVREKIIFDCNLVEQTSNADILSDELFDAKQNVKGFEASISEEVKREINDAVKKAKRYRTDIFGIGERFYIEHPQEFKEVQKNWPEIFAKADIQVDLEVKIRRVGLINRSINAQNK